METLHLTEGYTTWQTKTTQTSVHRQQDSANIELSKSNTLAVYDKQQGVKVRKQGFFGNLGRKTTLSGVQLEELLLENIEAFSEYEAQLLRAVFDLTILTAQEVMMPLSEITPLIVGSPPSEVLRLCRSSNYRYIPIYSELVDWLLGVVDVMDGTHKRTRPN